MADNPRWVYLANSPTAHLVYAGATLSICASARTLRPENWIDMVEGDIARKACLDCTRMGGVPVTGPCPVCNGKGRIIITPVAGSRT